MVILISAMDKDMGPTTATLATRMELAVTPIISSSIMPIMDQAGIISMRR